jgi:hypothetical protein
VWWCGCGAAVVQGIEVVQRVPIPPEMIPADAHVEIDAKVAVGYHGAGVFKAMDKEELKATKGRDYGEKGDPLSADFKPATDDAPAPAGAGGASA